VETRAIQDPASNRTALRPTADLALIRTARDSSRSESRKAASDDPARTAELAELAVLVADSLEEGSPFEAGWWAALPYAGVVS
jgi:hypothetical protein